MHFDNFINRSRGKKARALQKGLKKVLRYSYVLNKLSGKNREQKKIALWLNQK